MVAALLLGGAAAGTGCGAKAGMACRAAADCRAGLICSKQPGAPSTAYGVCEPARRGLGESCQRTSECQPGLFCSGDGSGAGGDGWFGTCEPAPDLGPPDGSGDL